MKEIIERRLINVCHLLHLLDADGENKESVRYSAMTAQKHILEDALSEAKVNRAYELQEQANLQIDLFGEAFKTTTDEMIFLIDGLTSSERVAFVIKRQSDIV